MAVKTEFAELGLGTLTHLFRDERRRLRDAVNSTGQGVVGEGTRQNIVKKKDNIQPTPQLEKTV